MKKRESLPYETPCHNNLSKTPSTVELWAPFQMFSKSRKKVSFLCQYKLKNNLRVKLLRGQVRK